MEALLPSSISPKISTILQSHVYPRVGHVFRVLARFKSLLLDALGKTKSGERRRTSSSKHAISYRSRSEKRTKITSFMKPHLTWSGSSSAWAEELDANHVCSCYESTWNAVVPAPAAVEGGRGDGTAEYCGYLCWLVEEVPDEVLVVEEAGEDVDGVNGVNEIDRLAEKFIARCHAKFLLEKQESYRRYQEMMARSMRRISIWSAGAHDLVF
ncbi:uncharacterized protein LOC133888767 [Phragmites australis]|uniref:uncharacterized protein LOC133888767 n=1 Tax=Phragmites australis TaxID=29695 RepID=UPI002D76F0B5|nr:uncharacterized protein LOC133888767 [Phragmites australis]XP_062185113.1 uncharacterized protein LOC133888767 [Phragmites australis]